jgi:tetratricopeptide (TPR) repeat protein
MKHTLIAHRSPWRPWKHFRAWERRCAPRRTRRPSARLAPPLAAALFAIVLFGPNAVRAGECPASSPEDPQERRRLAKEWFGAAEEAERAGNEAEATRAYACSYRMIAHPFTAFNLGRVAERSGDTELALKMFKAYLTLKPDAADAEDVKARIQSLEDRMAAAKETPPPTEVRAETPPEQPSEEPPAESLAPPPEPPPPTVTKRPEPEPEPEPQGPPSRVLEWVVGGVTAAAIVTGVGLMLAANSKMEKCATDAEVRDSEGNRILLATADEECNAARPLAYAGYALTYGVGIAGIVTEAALLLLRRDGSRGSTPGDSDDGTSVGFLPLPGGGAVTASGRF